MLKLPKDTTTKNTAHLRFLLVSLISKNDNIVAAGGSTDHKLETRELQHLNSLPVYRGQQKSLYMISLMPYLL